MPTIITLSVTPDINQTPEGNSVEAIAVAETMAKAKKNNPWHSAWLAEPWLALANQADASPTICTVATA
ncbi:MAG: hypothetical protein K8T25_18005 [Planctomycetia bacterium]|nr:hypothetical protein [Planctomycetia bacterium]